MTIRKRNALIPLTAGIIMILLFVCFMHFEKTTYETSVIEDLSQAELTGGDRYDTNRWRAMVYEPSLEIKGLNSRIRSIDVVVREIGSEETEYPQTLSVYGGSGSYDFFASDRVHLHKGVNRLVFDRLPDPVTELRLDFTGMHGKILDIEKIVLNSHDHVNLPFLPVICVVFILAAMELCIMLSTAGAVFFTAGLSGAMILGALGLLSAESMRIQPLFIMMLMITCVMLFLVASHPFRGKYAVFLTALLVSVFFISLWWSVITPLGDGPDEVMHLQIVDYIREHGSLPRGDAPEIRNEIWGFSYAFSPILPFMIGAGFERIGILMGLPSDSLYLAARLVSVLSGTLTVLFTALAARDLFPESTMKYALPVMAGFFPEFLFITAYVNSDAFAMMSVSLIILAWVRGTKKRWRVRECVLLSVALSLCALSYYNSYGFILMSIPLFILTAGIGTNRKKFLEKVLIIVLLVFAFSGWWFIRNAFLYQGDFLGRETLRKTAEQYAASGYRPSDRTSLQASGLSLIGMLRGTDWIRESLTSFIGRFSDFDLQVKLPLVNAYLLFIAVSLIGNFRMPLSVIREKNRLKKAEKYDNDGSSGTEQTDKTPEPRYGVFRMKAGCQIVLLISMLIPVALSLIYSYTDDFQPQGRYLLPALLPLLVFMAQGLDEIGSLLFRIAGGRRRSGEDTFAGSGIAAAGFSLAVIACILTMTVYRYYM